MATQHFSRRRLLTGASAVAAGLGALSASRALGANERIRIGVVGCGGRAGGLMGQVIAHAKKHNVEITALCDVWRVNLRSAAARIKKAFGKEPRQFTKFGELVALKDIDAVIIATPDYAHTPVMIAALEAGKDVYVEKPMSLEIPLANKALDLARAGKRVVQVGTQRRSEGRWHAAHKQLATGILGNITLIDSANHFAPHARWARSYANCKPEDVDWEAFLLNRPKRPFDPKLLRRWHHYKDFTNGLSGLWMAHLVDALHMIMGATYPRTAVAHGGTYQWRDGREHSDLFRALIDYPPGPLSPNGFMYTWSMCINNGAGTHYTIHGTNGTVDMYGTLVRKQKVYDANGKAVTRNVGIDAQTITRYGGLSTSKVEEKRLPSGANQDHMANWLECLRSRERPNADIQYGHQHAVATIMAAAALHQGRRMKYDPEKREMIPG
ncbi:Gfo/Idh/MocA family oxidoreductase [bacterium]|nr:Gfo/Idh/MocA family oxidoreductase [bacterium]